MDASHTGLAAVLLRGTVTGDPALVAAAMPGLPEPARTASELLADLTTLVEPPA